MTATSSSYAVYVSDDNGWMDGCQDHQGTFFGLLPAGAAYVGPRDSGFGGHVEFDSREAADAFAAKLGRSGDWTVKAPGHAAEGQDKRPTYAVSEVE